MVGMVINHPVIFACSRGMIKVPISRRDQTMTMYGNVDCFVLSILFIVFWVGKILTYLKYLSMVGW